MRTALLLVVLHSVWVAIVTAMIWRSYEGPGYQEELQLWMLVVAVPDLAALAFLNLLDLLVGERLYSSTSSQFAHVIFPSAVFLFFGGLQWAGIGWLFDRYKEQRN